MTHYKGFHVKYGNYYLIRLTDEWYKGDSWRTIFWKYKERDRIVATSGELISVADDIIRRIVNLGYHPVCKSYRTSKKFTIFASPDLGYQEYYIPGLPKMISILISD